MDARTQGRTDRRMNERTDTRTTDTMPLIIARWPLASGAKNKF